jgi:hypothetical protein
MEEPQRPTVSPRGELESCEQIDSLQVGVVQGVQVADERSRDRGGHLKIDRPPKENSSVSGR